MDERNRLEPLFSCAAEYRFGAFTRLFSKLESNPAGTPSEAYLLRAQIKLFAADESCADDLDKAGAAGAVPLHPCLGGIWMADCPNRIVVFSKAPGALERFLGALPRTSTLLEGWYGETGRGMASQIQSEILYYAGRFDEAVGIAETQLCPGREDETNTLLALCTLYRCHLATGKPDKAEQCMLDMITFASTHPKYLDQYKIIREWANLTTGWSGDTPRFASGVRGETIPVLEDRLEAIRHGISCPSPLEAPFTAYAQVGYADAYPLRQYYMDVFNAVYWFQAGDIPQSEAFFKSAYEAAVNSGLIMPIVEYGVQIVPLLEHALQNGIIHSEKWAGRISDLAHQYEKNLGIYRA
ncbi:hypothetical protein LJC60_06190 [Ruminococcaceae bacterium OttesenSCG-928-D13]|nr:hypothetical protein [Ruminococcaceae bacterium OttesenSCG-928-D13]